MDTKFGQKLKEISEASTGKRQVSVNLGVFSGDGEKTNLKDLAWKVAQITDPLHGLGSMWAGARDMEEHMSSKDEDASLKIKPREVEAFAKLFCDDKYLDALTKASMDGSGKTISKFAAGLPTLIKQTFPNRTSPKDLAKIKRTVNDILNIALQLVKNETAWEATEEFLKDKPADLTAIKQFYERQH